MQLQWQHAHSRRWKKKSWHTLPKRYLLRAQRVNKDQLCLADLYGGAMTEPPLYKYRSLANWQFFEDIVINRRLYAAPYRTLNDPMEGLLYLFDKKVSTTYRDSVRSASGRLNVCSLCESRSNTLLWSYYADGHKGVAIGVTALDRTSPRVDKPQKVTYDMTVTIDPKTERSKLPGAVAKRVLSQKLTFWNHEKEHRVFTTQRYVPVEIREIVLGCSISKSDARAVRELTSRHAPAVPVTQLERAELDWPGYQKQ